MYIHEDGTYLHVVSLSANWLAFIVPCHSSYRQLFICHIVRRRNVRRSGLPWAQIKCKLRAIKSEWQTVIDTGTQLPVAKNVHPWMCRYRQSQLNNNIASKNMMRSAAM